VEEMMILNVKEIAEMRGFKNAKQLADAAGLRYESAYPIWNGTARMIALDTLEKLCKVLRVQAGLLFEVIPDLESDKPRRSSKARNKPSAKE
jgi:DNA-binding Xre family transcriptional regulator